MQPLPSLTSTANTDRSQSSYPNSQIRFLFTETLSWAELFCSVHRAGMEAVQQKAELAFWAAPLSMPGMVAPGWHGLACNAAPHATTHSALAGWIGPFTATNDTFPDSNRKHKACKYQDLCINALTRGIVLLLETAITEDKTMLAAVFFLCV